MENICLVITYEGTHYSGFQVQDNAPTVQGELERALEQIYKQKVRLAGAGRTDSGVHARGQAAGYAAPFAIPTERLPGAFNSLLPADIVVTGASIVPHDFHARYSARGKIYSYTLDRAPYPQVMFRRFSWHYPEPLDLVAMRDAAKRLEGRHDFKAYQAAGSSVRDTERTLHRLAVEELPLEQLLRFTFEGDGFLYRMVRLITGSLLRVGRGQLEPAALSPQTALRSPGTAGPTAPAHGLCLEQVLY
jgi:tRNA pseudouridine38-40 synthase